MARTKADVVGEREVVDASYLECTGHGDAGERVRETLKRHQELGLEDLLEWGCQYRN